MKPIIQQQIEALGASKDNINTTMSSLVSLLGAQFEQHTFTITAGGTTVNLTGLTIGTNDDLVVFFNGRYAKEITDYTITPGTPNVLTTTSQAGDIVVTVIRLRGISITFTPQ